MLTIPSVDVDVKTVSAVWSPTALRTKCFPNVLLSIGIPSGFPLDPKEFPQF